MKVSELGEFGLIALLAKMISGAQDKQSASWQQLVLGIGDDAAAWRSGTATQLVTTDSLFQDVHFSLEITPWEELGWKSLAVNLSDIAAMGGIPHYALVSLALPGHIEVEDVAALYRGMIGLAEQFGVVLIGGDTCRAPLVSLTITVLGSTRSQNGAMLTRSVAMPGEKIAVTGCLGAAAAGHEMLKGQMQFEAEAAAQLSNAFLRPWPRVAEGQLLVEQGVRTAIDISDGLVADLRHICEASQVGARVEIDKVPTSPPVKANFGDRASGLALSGGEDYELLFTAGADVINRVQEMVSCPVTIIGEVLADRVGEVMLVDRAGSPFRPDKVGWEHFTAE